MSLEDRIGEPCNTEHADDCNHTGTEHGGTADGLRRSLCDHADESAGAEHEHLNNHSHGERFLTDHRTKFGEGTKQSNDEHYSKEDPHCGPLSGRELLAEESHRVAVNIALGFRISDKSLELRVFVEVFTAEVGVCSHDEQTDQTGRNGQAAEFNQADFSTVCHRVAGDQSDHRNAGDGHRRADHTHLSSDRGSCHRTFRTDTGLDCDVINNGEECVNRVACTAENCQRECAERSQEGYDFRTFSQNLFSDLKHAVQAAGSLQRRACCHHGDDGQNNVDRRFTRRKT